MRKQQKKQRRVKVSRDLLQTQERRRVGEVQGRVFLKEVVPDLAGELGFTEEEVILRVVTLATALLPDQDLVPRLHFALVYDRTYMLGVIYHHLQHAVPDWKQRISLVDPPERPAYQMFWRIKEQLPADQLEGGLELFRLTGKLPDEASGCDYEQLALLVKKLTVPSQHALIDDWAHSNPAALLRSVKYVLQRIERLSGSDPDALAKELEG